MGTIADKLAYLGQTKAEIRDAILSKGVTVHEKTAFREYAGKIRDINGEGGEEYPIEWRRPDEWLRIDDRIKEGDDKFIGLYAVFEDSNFVTLSATGEYTVDWGDGKIEDFSSGTLASHFYSYQDFKKTERSLGYRQAIITITSRTGEPLTSISLQERHPNAGMSSYSSGWLDIRVSGEYISDFRISGAAVSHRYLESFCFLGHSSITDFTKFFAGCTALQSVSLSRCTARGEKFSQMFQECLTLKSVPSFDTTSGVDFNSMFASCYDLQSVALLETSKGRDFSYMFQNCFSLQSIPLFDTTEGVTFSNMFMACVALKTIPLFNTVNGTDFGYMLGTCVSLKSIPLLDTANGTNFEYMFASCYRLETIPLLNMSRGESFYAMFANCTSLESIPLIDTSSGINFLGMFTNCSALKTIPPLNTAKGSVFSNMFSRCTRLQSIPYLETSSGVDFSAMFLSCAALGAVPMLKAEKGNSFIGMFAGCENLSKASLAEIRKSIDYSNCKLSKNALADIFKHLGSGEDHPTIIITNNWGIPFLESGDRDVALKKGWTIVE